MTAKHIAHDFPLQERIERIQGRTSYETDPSPWNPWQFLKDKKDDTHFTFHISHFTSFRLVFLDPTMVRRWCAAAAVVLLTLTGQAWVGQTLRNLTQIIWISTKSLLQISGCSIPFDPSPPVCFLLHVIPPQWHFLGRLPEKKGSDHNKIMTIIIGYHLYIYIYIFISSLDIIMGSWWVEA